MATSSRRKRRLSSADKARVKTFKDTFFEHDRLGELREAVLDALDETHPAEVIAVCGPTGVGKTTLLNVVARDAYTLYYDPGPSDMPVVSMVCEAPTGQGYDFNRDHWETVLTAMDDPFLDSHFDPDAAAARRRSGRKGHTSDRKARGSDLRKAAGKSMEFKRTKVLLLDEAQHMTGGPRSVRAGHNMDVIKKFGITTGVKQILFGTEQLFDLLRANAQLTRRTEELFFDVYNSQVKEDVCAFSEAYQSLAMSLPCKDPAKFQSSLDEAFFHCAGSVGILKETMVKSLRRALRQGRAEVPFSDFRAEFLSDARLTKVLSGVSDFRKSVPGDSGLDEYRLLWSLDARVKQPPAQKRDPPGTRKPCRDLVLPSASSSPDGL